MVQTLGPDSLGGVGTAEFVGQSDGGTGLEARTYRVTAGFDECPTCPHIYRTLRYEWGSEGFRKSSDETVNSPYYTFVDRFDMLGTGSNNVPMVTGNESEALVALVNGRMQSFRVPYPMGFYAKGYDGRIDNPSAGWKGKGIYSTFATRAPFHTETGKGTTSKVVKWQVRPNPLAK